MQRIKTSGLRPVLFLMTDKGIEEQNAKGCNAQHSGKKPKRRNTVTDVEGWGAGKVKTMKRSNQQGHMICLALNTIITSLFNCNKRLSYLGNDMFGNHLIKIGYSEKTGVLHLCRRLLLLFI